MVVCLSCDLFGRKKLQRILQMHCCRFPCPGPVLGLCLFLLLQRNSVAGSCSAKYRSFVYCEDGDFDGCFQVQRLLIVFWCVPAVALTLKTWVAVLSQKLV